MTARGRFVGRVVRNHLICAEHYRLVLAVDDFPPSCPGQFVQLASQAEEDAAANSTEPREMDWRLGAGAAPELTTEPPTPPGSDIDFSQARGYLRRPFSIAGRRDLITGAAEIDIVYRVVGKATEYLATLKTGNPLSLLGPLGRGFVIPPDMQTALLVGGGVGIPPMFYLAEALQHASKKAVAFVGAQRQDLVPLTMPPRAAPPSKDGAPVLNAEEFANYGFPTVITTDDGSLGMKGYVTAALRKYLEMVNGKLETPPHVFCCGPTPMMRATARLCAEFNVPCQVSLEQPMACGMGTCQSCVIRWHPLSTPPDAWTYKLTCTDGPVFDAREIIWEK